MGILRCIGLFRNYILLEKGVIKSWRQSFSHEATEKATEYAAENKVTADKLSVSADTIRKLEKLSLIEVNDANSIANLEETIKFANQIRNIDVSNEVEPMYTPLENIYMNLRDDKVREGYIRKKVLKNATVTEEEYFTAPLGNL